MNLKPTLALVIGLLFFGSLASADEITKGLEAQSRGNSEKAVKLFERYTKKHPDRIIGYTLLADVLMNLGRTEGMLANLEKAYGLQEEQDTDLGDRIELAHQLADIFTSLGRSEEALAYHERAYRLTEEEGANTADRIEFAHRLLQHGAYSEVAALLAADSPSSGASIGDRIGFAHRLFQRGAYSEVATLLAADSPFPCDKDVVCPNLYLLRGVSRLLTGDVAGSAEDLTLYEQLRREEKSSAELSDGVRELISSELPKAEVLAKAESELARIRSEWRSRHWSAPLVPELAPPQASSAREGSSSEATAPETRSSTETKEPAPKVTGKPAAADVAAPKKNEFAVARRDKFTAYVGARFVPGVKLHVVAESEIDTLVVARQLAADHSPLTVFFWSNESDIGKTAANHSVDCLQGPRSCESVF